MRTQCECEAQFLHHSTGPAPDWRQEGICQTVDPELFYPEPGHPVGPGRRICGTCPVQQQCLQEALALADDYGIWGGYTSRQRAALARSIRAWAAAARLSCPATGGIPLTVQQAYFATCSEDAA